MGFNEQAYMTDDTAYAEHFNTLLIIDALIEKYASGSPKFYILGGSCLLFHGLTERATLDIDIANRLEENLLDVVGEFISDNASEVAVLPKNYKERACKFHADDFNSAEFYLLSIEDLAVTKLSSMRVKDIDDLRHTKLLAKCDKELLLDIIRTEIDKAAGERCIARLKEM